MADFSSYGRLGGGWQEGRDHRTYTLVPAGVGRQFLPSTQLATRVMLTQSELLICGASWVLSDAAPLDHLAAWLLFFTQKFEEGVRCRP